MRTCLATLFTMLSGFALAADPSGTIFVGDLQSVDRAVFEASDLSLPSVGQAAHPRQAPSGNLPARGQTIRPAAYQAGMQPTVRDQPQQAEKKSRSTLIDKLPSWLTGKQSPTPVADPFDNAAHQARQAVTRQARRDSNVQAIPSHVGRNGSTNPPIATTAYERSTQSPPAMPQANRSARNSGIAIRQESGPRQGLLSGLFGESEPQAKPQQPIAQSMSRQSAAANQRPARSAAELATSSPGPSPSQRAAAPMPLDNRLREAPKSAPRPIARVASRTTATDIPRSSRQQTDTATVINNEPNEPAGSVVMISDSPSPAKPAAKAVLRASKPKPTMSDTPMIATESFAKKNDGAHPEPKTIVQQIDSTSPESMQPRRFNNEYAQPTESTKRPQLNVPKSVPSYAKTSGPKPVLSMPQAKANETTDAEPNKRSKALLAEAHSLAADADDYEGFSAVIQRCRYVLAIDQSSQAHDYANQLAGWALAKRGDTLEVEGRTDEARVDFLDAISCDSECWRAHQALGVIAARGGDALEALDRFNKTIEVNPKYAKAYSNRAALSVQAGDYHAALRDYQKAIELDPDFAVAHTGRGRICHMLGMMDEGLQHLDAAEILDPSDAMIAVGRGDLLTDLGSYGQALAAYKRAIELDPSAAAAHRNLAWMQATCPVASFRDGDSALEHAEIAQRLTPEGDDLMLDTKAAALAAVGRFDEAKSIQREAIKHAPESDTSVYLERLSLYERGESFTSRPVTVRQATYTK